MGPTEDWQVIPGTEGTTDKEEHRRFNGILSLYVGAAGKRGPNGAYRPGFDHRWTIWAYGTLLGEGFTDSASSARSACEREADRVEWRIRDAIKAMDVRSQWRNAGGNGSARAVWIRAKGQRTVEIWDIRDGYCEVVCWDKGERITTLHAPGIVGAKEKGTDFLNLD